jgi:hypothetical protein
MADGFQSQPAKKLVKARVEVVKPGAKTEVISNTEINVTALAFLRLLKRTRREESTK